jgi:methionyl-tRNA formyltransferase
LHKESSRTLLEALESHKPDLFVIFSYGEIISDQVLKVPAYGAINLHPSLLPLHRGCAPVFYTLLQGDRITGSSIIEVSSKMDAGDILVQQEYSIPEGMNRGDLEDALIEIGGAQLLYVINNYLKVIEAKKTQEESLASYTKKISPAICKLDLTTSKEEVVNKIRALSPYPGAWIEIDLNGDRKRLKILAATLPSKEDNRWQVRCKNGTFVPLQVQLEGKKELPISSFLKGVSANFSILE